MNYGFIHILTDVDGVFRLFAYLVLKGCWLLLGYGHNKKNRTRKASGFEDFEQQRDLATAPAEARFEHGHTALVAVGSIGIRRAHRLQGKTLQNLRYRCHSLQSEPRYYHHLRIRCW